MKLASLREHHEAKSDTLKSEVIFVARKYFDTNSRIFLNKKTRVNAA